ncbi:ATPase family associated with various cellular activities (AAA) domain-containing protein [Hirsutella rhossiliensis]|uniref:ATPase family associated with various cellular activities (AAA) domain-containing protein n=1 Tax=Hirsutella rhossiliensis TaxID=111463 RepID=A0A9P8SLU0_9HYPO|nr:ATPase family associated with various cellular activities (AAA) domain-containing protein [Hirsutella rhossiliensis]KAH0966634.1 ATPase family associated with various cellular activities (AAA) domain-containing protein [Hirsutella rhossiliensis]
MVKKSIEAKVRPLANPSLEKASLLGAARIYISKESLLALTNGLDHGRPCVVDKLDPPSPALPRRHAALWLLPDKNVGPNVVMMTRAYQEASGFRIGDQVRIALAEDPLPDADEVLVTHVAGGGGDDQQQQQTESKHTPGWEFSLSLSMDRAEHVFPGMLFEGVNINKLRRSFKVLSVNSKTTNLAKFQLASTTVRILQPGEQDAQSAAASGSGTGIAGDLVVSGVPGLATQVDALNRFLRGFGRPFWVRGERESCAFVVHGGRGTGKTMILRRVEKTRWGKAYWVRPSDKLSTLRETFRQARALQPSMVLVDGLEDLLAKERPNREAVIEALADELDSLADEAARNGALPRVVVVATCLDYMTDVPAKLQKRSRLRDNVALPIPRAPERLEILNYLDPPLRPEHREQCLASIAGKTHAFNGDDLANLVLNAKRILGDRLDRQGVAAASPNLLLPSSSSTSDPSPPQQQQQQQQQHFLTPDDMDRALRVTRPTAMHDINLKPPTIHWQDVGGQESLKRVLARMIKNAKDTNPASRHVLRHPPKGLLLYGPPGCSKTLSAQAMATESGFNFFAVKGAELLNMYVGESERAVRTLFERARAASPSIIFFDEIDSIGGQRGGGGGATSSARASSGAVNMLTTLLTEMDGFEALTGVLVLAATNRPEAIDPALLRPGRFDQVLYVGPPDLPAREAVFAVHLRGLALADDVDVPALARLADGYSGAEIKAICNEAGLAVLDRHDDDDDGKAAGATRNVTQDMIDGYEAWRRQFRRVP